MANTPPSIDQKDQADGASHLPPLTDEEITRLRRRADDFIPSSGPVHRDIIELHSLKRRVTDAESKIDIVTTDITALKQSMPNEDLDLHLDSHNDIIVQAQIRKNKDAENLRIWSELKKDIVQTIVKGLLVGLGVLLVLGIQTWVSNLSNKSMVDTPKAQLGATK